MDFWDDPGNWPGDGSWPSRPGETIEGTVTRMAVRTGRFGRPGLCLELDGDGRERWANSRLWRTLGDARVQVGDRIRVTRGPDEPMRPGQAHASTTWTVERAPKQQGGWGLPEPGGKPGAVLPKQAGPTW